MNRKNMLLLAILAVQLVLVALAFRPTPKAASETKEFLPDLAKDSITGLTVSDDQKSLELFVEDGKWYVDRAEKYPADPQKVSELLDKLTKLQSNQLVTRTPSSQVRLKVAEQIFNRKLTIAAKDKKSTLFLGTSPSNKTMHVRADGENEVYLVNGLSSWEIQPSAESWWRGKYLGIAVDDIKGVTLANGGGSFTLALDVDKKWHLTNRQEAVSEQAVKELLTRVADMSVLKYMGREDKKEYGLEQPLATVTVTLQDGSSQTLRIGVKNKDENNHVIKSDGSPFYASTAEYAVEPIINAKAESLLAPKTEESAAQKPEPAKEESASPPEK